LLDTTFGGIGGQPEKTQTGDQDRQPREHAHDPADLRIGTIDLGEMFVEELVFQWLPGEQTPPHPLNIGDRLIRLTAFELDRHDTEKGLLLIEKEHGLDLMMQRIEIEIANDSDDHSSGIEPEMPADQPVHRLAF